jgi:hypothetical protein
MHFLWHVASFCLQTSCPRSAFVTKFAIPVVTKNGTIFAMRVFVWCRVEQNIVTGRLGSINAVDKGTKEDLQGRRFYGRFFRLCSAPSVIWAIENKELD